MLLTIQEINSQINNLKVLRSFPSLNLSNSLILQKNLKKLEEKDSQFKESENILRDKLKVNEEEKPEIENLEIKLKENKLSDLEKSDLENYNKNKLSIINEFENLWKEKYEVEFITIPLSLFPDDINTKPSKKITTGEGKEIEISYVDVLLDSIGYSIQDNN